MNIKSIPAVCKIKKRRNSTLIAPLITPFIVPIIVPFMLPFCLSFCLYIQLWVGLIYAYSSSILAPFSLPF
jgi:hypothetical protein